MSVYWVPAPYVAPTLYWPAVHDDEVVPSRQNPGANAAAAQFGLIAQLLQHASAVWSDVLRTPRAPLLSAKPLIG